MAGESALWNWLSARLPPGGRYSRIESDTSPGFPDVDYTYQGASGTIELKSARFPKSLIPFRTGGLRDSQKTWIQEELKAKGTVFIAARIEPFVYFFHGRDWGLLEQFEPKNPRHDEWYIRKFAIRPTVESTVPDCRTFLSELIVGLY